MKLSARSSRAVAMNVVMSIIIFVYLLWSYGFLSSIPELFGKSSDLSSRTEYWSIAMDVFKGSGDALLGGGYAVGLQHLFPEFVYVDNGYIDVLMQFGYLGSCVVAVFVIWLMLGARRIIVEQVRRPTALDVFPMAMTFALGFIFITEST